jgi:hypothetical protein
VTKRKGGRDGPPFFELAHDPEKWKPVFGKDHAPTKNPVAFLI